MIVAALVFASHLAIAPARADAGRLAQADLWQNFTPRQRYDAMRNYREYEQRPEDQQRTIDEQYQRWQAMPEDERDRIRQNYERYRALPSPERDRFRRKYQQWKKSKPDE